MSKKLSFFSAFMACTVLVAGCSTPRGLQPTSGTAPTDAESVFVLGVQPAATKLWFSEGSIAYDHFVPAGTLENAAVIGFAQNGYVVGRVKGGSTLGVMNINFPFTESVRRNYGPCGGNKATVFTIPSGKVVYLGSLNYRPNGAFLATDAQADLEAARRYIDANYPNLRGRLEPHAMRSLTTTRSCVAPATVHSVPVYIPVKKK